MSEFSGKVAVVTGAGSGMGRATAELLAERGASVVCADLSGAESVVAKQIGTAAVPVSVDVLVEADVRRMIDTALDSFGRLDMLCNVAGIHEENGLVTDLDVAQWDRILGVNARGMLLGMKHALPALVKTGGAVVNVASTAAVSAPGPGNAAYSASKAAIGAITRTAAVEFGLAGVRVNAVLPGMTHTSMSAGLDQEGLQHQFDHSLLGRGADPREIAEVVAFLASPRASYVTGILMPVDGGALTSYTSRGHGDSLVPRSAAEFAERHASGAEPAKGWGS